MKIEVVEIYKVKNKSKNKNFIGTAHVYLCDYDIDLRGIGVFKKSQGYKCILSDRMAIDEATKKPVRYPVFRFTNVATHKDLITAICDGVAKYLEEKK